MHGGKKSIKMNKTKIQKEAAPSAGQCVELGGGETLVPAADLQDSVGLLSAVHLNPFQVCQNTNT